MEIIDIIILLVILSFGLTGASNGFFKQTVLTIGTILVFVLSYKLKDYIANFLSYRLPFFNFSGPFEGLTTVNIILYQMISFILVFLVLTSVLVVLLKITGVFEKILKFTVILGIPSKILGFIVGLVEGYVIAFIALFFLNQPAVDLNILDNSKFNEPILTSSPVLSSVVEDTNETVKELYVLVKDYTKDKDAKKFNQNAIDIMLENKIITVEYVETLINKNKLEVTDIGNILDKYN